MTSMSSICRLRAAACRYTAHPTNRRHFWTKSSKPPHPSTMPTASSNGSSPPLADRRPFMIGVCGGTASGKSSVCRRIMDDLSHEQQRQVAVICQDSFYRELSVDEGRLALQGDFNFDHPDSIDHDLLLSTMRELRAGRAVHIPRYDFKTNARVVGEHIDVLPVDVVLVEGILVFSDAAYRDMFNMKVFVDTDADIRLARRVRRDIQERGRELDTVLHQYETFVKPCYEVYLHIMQATQCLQEFCLPTKKYADVIIPRGADNLIAIDLIVKHIQEFLRSPRSTPTGKENGVTPLGVSKQSAGNGVTSPVSPGARRPH